MDIGGIGDWGVKAMMGKTVYTVKLPDGGEASRTSPRPYTHAVVRVMTAEEKARLIKGAKAECARAETELAAWEKEAAISGAKEAHEKAVAEMARLEYATHDAERFARHLAAMNHLEVGKATVTNWSMSAKGAAKLAEAARKPYPLARVYVTTEIEARAVKAREKKEKPVKMEWRGVLAGAYQNDAAMERMVAHLVLLEPLSLSGGKKGFKRNPGDLLCYNLNRDSMSDAADDTSKRCPGCLHIVEMRGLTIATE